MSKSRVVFVGNIPYDMTEEQIIDIFKEVGPVVSFRLMFDRETGKPRGYGFCEYADAETAASAILNGYDVGGRTLRVDRADNDMQPSNFVGAPSSAASVPPSVSSIHAPPATTVPSPSISVEAINATLASMTNAQLMEAMVQIKNMAMNNPEQTRQLLHSNPSLTYAVFQALVTMKLIDPIIVQQIMAQASTQFASGYHHPHPTQVQPPPVSAPPAQTPTDSSAEQQRAMIMQIMALTPEQIAALPPQQREQIMQLVH